jgi:hypothetical protein
VLHSDARDCLASLGALHTFSSQQGSPLQSLSGGQQVLQAFFSGQQPSLQRQSWCPPPALQHMLTLRAFEGSNYSAAMLALFQGSQQVEMDRCINSCTRAELAHLHYATCGELILWAHGRIFSHY